MNVAGDGFRWSVEPDLDLSPLRDACQVIVRFNGQTFDLRSRKRISEVIEACRTRFGVVA